MPLKKNHEFDLECQCPFSRQIKIWDDSLECKVHYNPWHTAWVLTVKIQRQVIELGHCMIKYYVTQQVIYYLGNILFWSPFKYMDYNWTLTCPYFFNGIALMEMSKFLDIPLISKTSLATHRPIVGQWTAWAKNIYGSCTTNWVY